jgi:hypothetical protein
MFRSIIIHFILGGLQIKMILGDSIRTVLQRFNQLSVTLLFELYNFLDGFEYIYNRKFMLNALTFFGYEFNVQSLQSSSLITKILLKICTSNIVASVIRLFRHATFIYFFCSDLPKSSFSVIDLPLHPPDATQTTHHTKCDDKRNESSMSKP